MCYNSGSNLGVCFLVHKYTVLSVRIAYWFGFNPIKPYWNKLKF